MFKIDTKHQWRLNRWKRAAHYHWNYWVKLRAFPTKIREDLFHAIQSVERFKYYQLKMNSVSNPTLVTSQFIDQLTADPPILASAELVKQDQLKIQLVWQDWLNTYQSLQASPYHQAFSYLKEETLLKLKPLLLGEKPEQQVYENLWRRCPPEITLSWIQKMQEDPNYIPATLKVSFIQLSQRPELRELWQHWWEAWKDDPRLKPFQPLLAAGSNSLEQWISHWIEQVDLNDLPTALSTRYNNGLDALLPDPTDWNPSHQAPWAYKVIQWYQHTLTPTLDHHHQPNLLIWSKAEHIHPNWLPILIEQCPQLLQQRYWTHPHGTQSWNLLQGWIFSLHKNPQYTPQHEENLWPFFELLEKKGLDVLEPSNLGDSPEFPGPFFKSRYLEKSLTASPSTETHTSESTETEKHTLSKRRL